MHTLIGHVNEQHASFILFFFHSYRFIHVCCQLVSLFIYTRYIVNRCSIQTNRSRRNLNTPSTSVSAIRPLRFSLRAQFAPAIFPSRRNSSPHFRWMAQFVPSHRNVVEHFDIMNFKLHFL